MNETYRTSGLAGGQTLKFLKHFLTEQKSWMLLVMLSITTFSFGQIIVGAGDTSSTIAPFSSCYGYTYHQMIYPQSQIGAAGTITSLTFTSTGSLPTTASGATPNTPQAANTNFKVYIGHTSKSTFDTNTDWIPVGNLTMVFDGALTMPTVSGQSLVVTLTTPFAFNNTDNLVIAFDENSPGYSCSYSWVASSGQTNKSIYYRNDSTNPDPTAPPTGTRASLLPKVSLGGLVASNPPSCVSNFAPADGAQDVALNPSFTWTNPSNPSATSFDVYFGTSTEPTLLGNFTTAADATNALPSLLMANTAYYVKVVPKNDAGAALNCVTSSFTTGSSLIYCPTTYSSGCDTDAITNVVVGSYANPTGCSSGTGTYYAETGIEFGRSTLATVAVSFGSDGNQYSAIWIDFNQDGEFSASEGVLGSSNPGASGTLVYNIPIPTDAPLGMTRMRIRGGNDSVLQLNQACGVSSSTYGETEDYQITITEAPSNPPTCVATTTPADSATAVVRNASLSWAGAEGFPTSYDIYFGTSENPSFVTNIASTSTSYTPEAMMANTTYYWKVVPKNDNGEAEGCVVQSFTTGSNFVYCASNSTNSADTKVGSFTLAGITKNAANGCVNYTDRTADAPFVLQKNVATPLTIELGTCSTSFYSSYTEVYIDFNQNGSFEEEEMVFGNSLGDEAPDNIASGEFTLPLSAINGTTRMRLVLRESGSAFSTTACGTYSYGETQDYTVNIIDPLPTTQLRTQFCNATLSTLNANIYANNMAGAEAYKFKITNGANVQEVTRPDSRFSMAFASGILANTTYEVAVANQVNGVWSAYGNACNVTTPMVYPLTELRTQFCNTTLSSIADNIYANVVVSAEAYKFKVVNGTDEQEFERPDSRFSLTFATGIQSGTTYNISVALLHNGVWGDYGNVCSVTTPAMLPTSQLRSQFCGNAVPSLGSNFYAVVKAGATAYRFKTMIGSEEVVVERPNSRCFMSAFAGATMNQTYMIQVAVAYNGVWSEYGAFCNLTVGESTQISKEMTTTNFEVKTYPNPFTNQATLLLSNKNVVSFISVYDMTGKMISSFETSENEVIIGQQLSTGIYMIQVVQGQEIKTIRVVKQ